MLRVSGQLAVVVALLVVAAGAGPVCAQPDPMVEMAAEALAVTVDETGDKWFEMVVAQPNDPDEAAFADWLVARPDIASAVVDGNAIEAKTVIGITVRFVDYQPGVKGAGGPQLGSAVIPVMQAVPGKLRCIGEVVPGTKALIIDTDGGIVDDPDRHIQRMLEHANYTVIERRGGVKAFLEMSDAAVTIVDAHGGTNSDSTHFMVVAEQHQTTNVSSLVEYYNWMVDGQIALQRSVIRDKVTKAPVAIVTGVDVYDTWFDKNIPSMPNNAAVFFYTCASMDLVTGMWPILKKKGASFYFGFTGTVGDPWGIDWLKRYLERLTGANIYDPWDTDPPRRAQSFLDALGYIIKRPQYLMDPVHGGMPGYNIYYDDPTYSLAPHIDTAQVWPVHDDRPNYEVMLYGALGRADESKVYCGGQPAQFTSVSGGNGAPFRALIPLGTTGPIVVNDQWGRQSNAVMISRLTGEVVFKYDDPEKAGTVKLTYSCLVTGSRLYRPLAPEQRFAGVNTMNIPGVSAQVNQQMSDMLEQGGYPFVEGSGDWILEWNFSSTKRIGPTVITARGRSEVNGRGNADEDNEPDAFLTVLLKPVTDDASATTCNATVCAGATIGPITITYDSPAGRETKQSMVVCAGLPASCTYDLVNGSLPEITGGLAAFGTWTLKPVTITPNPYDLEMPAWVPDELRDVGRLATLNHLFAPPSRG